MEQLVHSPKSLGNAIKRQRNAKKLSQKNAGGAFKIEQSTLSSIEQGAEGTRLSTLFRILAALDLEIIVRSKENSARKNKENW
jgi:HTH-type transcriptional regulator / antitoxin HipB